MSTKQQSEPVTRSLAETPQRPGTPSRGDWLLLGGFALVALVVHLALYRGYGFFRDELYFIACGKHLAWGYVDHPPGTPLIAWTSQKILGDTLFAIRFVPILFAVAQLILTGLTARAMGGGRYAQFLTCLCVFGAPQYFGTWLNTDMFMTLGWAACAWVAARIFAGESERLWLLFGLFAGLALQGKHAMLFFLIAFFAGIAVSPQRKLLLRRWLWYGAAIAFLIALPNVIWEYKHHWATYELLSNIAQSDKNLVLGPWQYLKSNLDSLGMLTLLVWVPGLIWCLFLKDGKRFRALGWTWIFSFVLFIALKGKTYYLTPLYPMLFAAGGVAIESWLAHTPRLLRLVVKPASGVTADSLERIAEPVKLSLEVAKVELVAEKAIAPVKRQMHYKSDQRESSRPCIFKISSLKPFLRSFTFLIGRLWRRSWRLSRLCSLKFE